MSPCEIARYKTFEECKAFKDGLIIYTNIIEDRIIIYKEENGEFTINLD